MNPGVESTDGLVMGGGMVGLAIARTLGFSQAYKRWPFRRLDPARAVHPSSVGSLQTKTTRDGLSCGRRWEVFSCSKRGFARVYLCLALFKLGVRKDPSSDGWSKRFVMLQ